MLKTEIILASASPRRRQLLKAEGYAVKVIPSAIDEAMHFKRPSDLVMFNARRKALDIAHNLASGWVIGADTVIYFRRKIMGKPKSRRDAFRMLRSLQGGKHFVYTGVCLCQVERGWVKTFYDRTQVTFRPLSPKQIRDYHSRIQPMDKAGAYAIHQHGDRILAGLKGSYSNVIGFPLEKFRDYWRRYARRSGKNGKVGRS